MKVLLHILYSITSLSFVALIALTLTGHLVVASVPRMVNVVDRQGNVLFQMATGIVDYRVVLVK